MVVLGKILYFMIIGGESDKARWKLDSSRIKELNACLAKPRREENFFQITLE